MSMNGIDISRWQAGINLAAVPCEFVVIKATEGTTYVNPYWASIILQEVATQLRKPSIL